MRPKTTSSPLQCPSTITTGWWLGSRTGCRSHQTSYRPLVGLTCFLWAPWLGDGAPIQRGKTGAFDYQSFLVTNQHPRLYPKYTSETFQCGERRGWCPSPLESLVVFVIEADFFGELLLGETSTYA